MTHRDRRLLYVAISGCMIALVVVIELAMGRTAFCRCGSIRLWSGDPRGPENSQQFTDAYTFTHITHGVLVYGLLHLVGRRSSLGARGVLAVAIESSWEVLENTDWIINRYRAATMALGYHGDSVFNSVGDIAACMVGFALSAYLPTRVTVALVIVMEVAQYPDARVPNQGGEELAARPLAMLQDNGFSALGSLKTEDESLLRQILDLSDSFVRRASYMTCGRP